MKKEKDTFTWVNKNEEKLVPKDGWADLTPKPDPVNSPSHYKEFSVECISMMVSIYGAEKVAIFCELNAFKYRIRAGNKDDALQDLAKAQWYMNKRRELLDGSK